MNDLYRTPKPYHVMVGGRIRCENCGRLAYWVDSIKTKTGYLCPLCDAEGDPHA